MSFFSSNRPALSIRPRHRIRPRLDSLEDRVLLTAGDLDTTFGGSGVVLTSFPGVTKRIKGTAGNGFAIAVQSDGKIIAAGWGQYDFAVARYNANGSLDTTFGSGGKVVTTFNQQLNASADALAIQPDGKIIVVGNTLVSSTGSYGIFAMARYNTNGTLDKTFGPSKNGLVTTKILGSDNAHAVTVQTDGKIVLAGSAAKAGTSTNSDALVRYNANGSLDTTFGQGGIVTQTFVSGVSQWFTDVTLETVNGTTKIVAAGTVRTNPVTSAVARFNLDGSLDTSFGSGGSVIMSNVAPGFAGTSLAIQPDGKIVNSCAFIDSQGVRNGAVARLNVDGTLDTTFNPGGSTPGVVVVPGTGGGQIWDGKVEPDGKIVAVGLVAASGSPNAMLLTRVNTDGSLDTSFGSGGVIVETLTGGTYARDLAFQSDGKVVTVGQSTVGSTTYFGVARFLGDTQPLGAQHASGVATPTIAQTILDPFVVPLVLDDPTFTGAVIDSTRRHTAAGRARPVSLDR